MLKKTDLSAGRIAAIPFDRAGHLNTLAQALVNGYNRDTTHSDYQITMPVSGDNYGLAIGNKIQELKSKLTEAQKAVFPSADHELIRTKLGDDDVAASIANTHGGTAAEKALELQLDSSIRAGLLHDDIEVRILTFGKLMQKINLLSEPNKKQILEHLETITGVKIPSDIEPKALEKVILIREHLTKLEQANSVLTRFYAEENLRYAAIYKEMQQNLSGTSTKADVVSDNVKTTEALKNNPTKLEEPRIETMSNEDVAKYLEALSADASANVTITAHGGHPAFIIPKANLEALVNAVKTGTDIPSSIKDSKGNEIQTEWIIGRSKALINDSFSGTTQERAENYNKEYKPAVYESYKKSNIVDYILASLKMILNELTGASSHA